MQAGAKRPSSFSESEDWPQVRPSSQRGREMLSCSGALQDIAGKQRGLGLRLTVAAHRAIDHHPAIVQARRGGVEGMERLFARGQRQEMLRIEAEGRPAVLPDDPGVRDHHAAAKLVIDALNE